MGAERVTTVLCRSPVVGWACMAPHDCSDWRTDCRVLVVVDRCKTAILTASTHSLNARG